MPILLRHRHRRTECANRRWFVRGQGLNPGPRGTARTRHVRLIRGSPLTNPLPVTPPRFFIRCFSTLLSRCFSRVMIDCQF